MSSILPPVVWNGRFVPTLEALVFMRDQIRSGVMLEIFIGRLDVRALSSFTDGIHFHQFCCGQKDEQYMAFIDWLREVCGEFPSPGGWQEKYLADAGGDHRAAIMRFLDRCAEFVTLSKGR
ncbi:hypothetical protein ACN28S_27305 [Cystobacter fuscus]